jgi:hypothetical protein
VNKLKKALNRTIIYRVEHPYDGKGPYTGYYNCLGYFPRSHNRNTHPNPYMESNNTRFMQSNEYCGFESISAFKKWFNPKERQILKDKGFELIQMSVLTKNVIKFEKQLIFKKTKTLIKIRPVNILS